MKTSSQRPKTASRQTLTSPDPAVGATFPFLAVRAPTVITWFRVLQHHTNGALVQLCMADIGSYIRILIEEDVAGRDRGLIYKYCTSTCLEGLNKATKCLLGMVCFRAKIWTQDVPYTKQEFREFGRNFRCLLRFSVLLTLGLLYDGPWATRKFSCRKISPTFLDRYKYTAWWPASRGTGWVGKR